MCQVNHIGQFLQHVLPNSQLTVKWSWQTAPPERKATRCSHYCFFKSTASAIVALDFLYHSEQIATQITTLALVPLACTQQTITLSYLTKYQLDSVILKVLQHKSQLLPVVKNLYENDTKFAKISRHYSTKGFSVCYCSSLLHGLCRTGSCSYRTMPSYQLLTMRALQHSYITLEGPSLANIFSCLVFPRLDIQLQLT